MTASAVRQSQRSPRSLRALTASLLAGTSLLTVPVTVIHIGATAAIAGASLWLGATPAAAQSRGGTGGDSGYGTAGGSGGPGYGAPGSNGTTAAVLGGGGGGGGGPGAVGGAGGGAGGAGGSYGPIGTAGGNGGTGAGGGGGGGGATGGTTFSNAAISGGAGGAGGLGGSTVAAGEAGGGGGGGGAGGYGVFYAGGVASIVTGTLFAASGGAGGAGGNGGASGAGRSGASGGAGGGGGLGLNLCGCVGSFTNNGNIFGGAGGNGGNGGAAGAGGPNGGNGGAGGAGGWGVISYTTTFINNGTITGGNGGNGGAGGAGSTAGSAGQGGNGGFGFYGGNTIVNNGTISGGVGGSGATRSGYGMAVLNVTLTNTGTIAGGNASGASGTAGIGINANAYGAGNVNKITNSGTIRGGSGGVGGGAAAIVGNRMHIVNSGTIAGGGGAAIFFTGGNNSLELQPGYVVTGTVSNFGGGGTNSLKFGGSSGSASFDLGSIGSQYLDFSSFTVTGATWTFTGTATQTDPWTISGGTALINGNLSSASSLTVNGGTLGGTGTVGNTTINSGATFAPGTPGTANTSMTVSGNLTFNSGATYAVTLDPSSSTSATVSGTATLAGAVAATYQSGSYLSKTYNILSANSLSGTFSSLNNTNLPSGFAAALAYSGGTVQLILTMTQPNGGGGFPGSGSGLPGNQQNVFNAISGAFNNGSSLPPGFVTLAGSGNPDNAYGQAAGQPGATITQAGLTAAGQFVNTIFDGAMSGGGPAGGAVGFAQEDGASAYASNNTVSREARDAYAAVTPRDRRGHAAPSFGPRWGAWASVYGGNNRVSGNAAAGTNTTTSDAYGVVAGADYRVSPALQLGFALGGAGSRFDVANGFGGGRADIFTAALYGKYTFGPAYLAAAVAYGWQDVRTDRTVTIAGFDVLHASFHAHALSGRLEAGYRCAAPLLAVTPYAALQSTTFYLPGYGETATTGSNQFALSYAAHDPTATRGELGARFDKAMAVNGGVLSWKGKLAFAHDWNTDRSAIATFQTLPAATFTVNGAQPSANAALVSLGAEMNWHNGWSLGATFDGEFSRTTAAYAGKGTLRYVW